MPSRAIIRPLLHIVIDFIVERIDEYFKIYYNHRLKSFKYDARPEEGPFGKTPNWILLNIITKLVRRKKLSLKHLLVLLPQKTKIGFLICDDREACTAFKPHLLQLIVTRCPTLQELHYHCFKGPNYDHVVTIDILNKSIPRLSHLKKIDFHDSPIGDETIIVIASSFIGLETLNLSNTDITDRGITYLLIHGKIIKSSLTKLSIDYTRISAGSIANIYLNFTNLRYFMNDFSIYACVTFLRARLETPALYGMPIKANTTILKNSFSPYKIEFPNQETLRWFAFMFSNVASLILTNIKRTDDVAIYVLILNLKNVNHLQLSAEVDEINTCPFSILRKSIDVCGNNLYCLKIEKFSNVDVIFLGTKCQNLGRLLLINNSYDNVRNATNLNLFKNLTELQVMLLLDQDVADANNVSLSEDSFFSMLLSCLLKKILVISQTYFSDELIGKLLAKGYLKELKEMYVYQCSQISEETIWTFVNSLDQIKIVEVGLTNGVTEDSIKEISTYIKNNNYDVSVSLVNKLPARIRWYVVDLPLNGKSNLPFADVDYDIDALFR